MLKKKIRKLVLAELKKPQNAHIREEAELEAINGSCDYWNTVYIDGIPFDLNFWDRDEPRSKYLYLSIYPIGADTAGNAVALTSDPIAEKIRIRVRRTKEKLAVAVLRRDLRRDGLSIPVGENDYIDDDKPRKYRWKDEVAGLIEVFHNGKWKEAYSIDFEFLG